MRRALVTGSHGFVGANVCRRLVKDGWLVTCVDNLSTGAASALDGLRDQMDHWFVGTLFNLQQWCRGYHSNSAEQCFDLVVHCAAVVGGRLKIEGDPLGVAEDLEIDSALFQWAVKAKPKKIIYFSSSAVYPIELQTRDNHCQLAEHFTHFDCSRIGRPDESYGWSKLTGEYLAKQAVDRYGLDVVIYRPFSGYGEDQSFDYPFPSIIRRVISGEDPITVWGSGDQVRDFIHIDDIVDCVLQTMDALKPGEVLNLGSGKPISFKNLALMACDEIHGPVCNGPDIVCDKTKPEGVFYRVADTSKMNRFYKPKVSLEEGIRRVAAHLRK